MIKTQTTVKVCPETRLPCLHDLGENCACYVKVFQNIPTRPDLIQTYEGCGLIATVPWHIKPIQPIKEK